MKAPGAERAKNAGYLEFDAHAAADALEGFQRRDVLAGIDDAAAGRQMLAKQQAKQSTLAGAIGADQAVQLALFQREVDVRGDVQPAKVLVEVMGFEQRHQTRSLRPRQRRTSPAPLTIHPSGAASTVTTSNSPITTSAYWLP